MANPEFNNPYNGSEFKATEDDRTDFANEILSKEGQFPLAELQQEFANIALAGVEVKTSE